jgi:hypothetical protein
MQVMKLLVERRIDRDIGGVASWSDEQCDRVARVLRVRGHHISDCKERQRGYILSLVMIFPERQKSADRALLFLFILADCLKRTLQGDYWLKWVEILLPCKSL